MDLNPVSKKLNRTGYGYRVTTGHGETAKRHLISHLLFMDDLKLYGRNSDQLHELLHTVRTFSDDMQTKFSLYKCAIAHLSMADYLDTTLELRQCTLQDLLAERSALP